MVGITLDRNRDADYKQKCIAIEILGRQNWERVGQGGAYSSGVTKTDIETVEKYGFGFVHCTLEEWNAAMKSALAKV